MSDLAGFILARIAEDEEWGERCAEDTTVSRIKRSRVLAECEAKRRIVALHGGDHACEGDRLEWHGNGRRYFLCDTLRALALPYADHPDYREEWRA